METVPYSCNILVKRSTQQPILRLLFGLKVQGLGFAGFGFGV